jgi:rubredoxin
MAQFRCKACYYVYDEYKGDPWGMIKPGTLFKELPKDWVCPICLSKADMFKEVSEEEFLKEFFERLDKKISLKKF